MTGLWQFAPQQGAFRLPGTYKNSKIVEGRDAAGGIWGVEMQEAGELQAWVCPGPSKGGPCMDMQ